MDNVAGQLGAARLQGIGMRTWRRTLAEDSGDSRHADGSWIWQTTKVMMLWEMGCRLGHGATQAWQKDHVKPLKDVDGDGDIGRHWEWGLFDSTITSFAEIRSKKESCWTPHNRKRQS
ncbi:hypothetical protein TgHK011_007054 [Trichoderma gracile]|nr:hypothetical protein TgHK011_007054 [Trichoderma gracile]